MGKNYPPNDEAGYMEALTKLRSPLLAEAVKHRRADFNRLFASRDGQSMAAL